MESPIEVWSRNSFDVQAVRMTEDNMRWVAYWCGGRIKRTENHEKSYVEFGAVHYNKIYMAKAYVGDWIILVEDDFKHYRDKSFREAYSPVKTEIEKREEVLKILAEYASMLDEVQRVYNVNAGPSILTPGFADKILQVFAK